MIVSVLRLINKLHAENHQNSQNTHIKKFASDSWSFGKLHSLGEKNLIYLLMVQY